MAPLIFRPVARSLIKRFYSTVQGAASSVPASALASSWTISTIPAVVNDAAAAHVPRTSWTRNEVQQVYETPLSQLMHAAVRHDVSLV